MPRNSSLKLSLPRIGSLKFKPALQRLADLWPTQLLNNRPRRIATLGLTATLIIAVVLIPLLTNQAAAASYTIGSRQILDGYSSFNQINTTKDGTISLQAGDIGQWHGYDGMQKPPAGTASEAIYGPNNRIFFLSERQNICRFMQFDVETSRWLDNLTAPPAACGRGMGLSYDGVATIYYFPAGDSSSFYSYDIRTDSWGKLPDVPMSVGAYAKSIYVPSGGGKVYAFRGGTSAVFLSYDISTKSWEQKSPFPTTSSVNYGITLAWDGGGYIYALSSHYNHYRRYSILTDQWVDLTAPPDGSYSHNRLLLIKGVIYNLKLKWGGASNVPGNFDDMQYLYRYQPATDTWDRMPDPPQGTTTDDIDMAAVFDGDDNLYIVAGNSNRRFYKYTFSTSSWNNDYLLEGIKNRVLYHGTLMFDNGHTVYYSGGPGQNDFNGLYKLDLSTGETIQINTYPSFGTRVGFAGLYANNALYMTSYSNTYSFAKYDLATNSWIQLPDLPYRAYYGMAMVNGGDGYFYTTFGGGSANFYRFSEASGWQQMASAPHGINHAHGSLTKIGNSLYALVANNYYKIMRYDLATNTWIDLDTNTPNGTIEYGSTMIGDGTRYLYVVPSNRLDTDTTRLFYRYDTVANQWKRMADLPAQVNLGAEGFYDKTHNRLYLAPDFGSPYLWHWTPTTGTYQTSGSWYSKTFDLIQVQGWTSIQLQSSGSGQVKIFSRSSPNGRVWSNWQQVNGNSISSPLNRYWQFRVDLTGDGQQTPTVSGLQLQYTQETQAPTLPSQLNARGTKDGEVLSSGQTYEYQHPYFSWQGSEDGSNGSGVDGYYVYFGTNSNADPQTDGNYQKQAEYTVTSAMEAGSVNYLRLKVKDKLGNISDAATYFSYRYWYISPPASILKDSKDDFARGENSLVELNAFPGDIKLRQQEGGAWSTGTMQMLPLSSYGGAGVVIGDYLYILRGSSTTTFWRYHLINQIWETLPDAPDTIYYGSSLTWDKGRYLYAFRNNTSTDFYRYDLQNATWSQLPNLPAMSNGGSDMEYIGNGKIAMIFPGTTDFYIYDIANEAFVNYASMPQVTNASWTGSGIWYDGKGKLYVYFGGYIGQNYQGQSFASYNIATDSWQSLNGPAAGSLYTENNLVGDGSGNLYIFGSDTRYGDKKAMASKYSIATDSWTTIPEFYAYTERGTVISDEYRYIYIIPSTNGSSYRIVKYDTWNNIFEPQGYQPSSYNRVTYDDNGTSKWTTNNATTVAYDNNKYIYALGSAESNASRFIRYSVVDGETEYLSPPLAIGNNGSITYLDGYIYYLVGRTTPMFTRYNIGTKQWEEMADYPTTSVQPGPTSLVTGKDGRIYSVRGSSATQFYRYNPDNGIGSWSTLASLPGSARYVAAAYDGDNYIYALRANSTSSFYRYSISDDSWTTLASYPTAVSYASSLIYNNEELFAITGNGSKAMSIYNIATDAWRSGSDTPGVISSGAVAVKVDAQRFLMFGGAEQSDIWQFNFPSPNTAYNGLATHISQPMQIDGLYDYATLKAEVNIPANTQVELWTRTSPDQETWEDWKITKDVKYYGGQMSGRVMSSPQKFTQVKVILYSHDNLYSPTVSSYALDYYFDVDPPQNPTVMENFSDASKQKTIQNNTWYNFDKPLFDWPEAGQAGGATDGPIGSNLKGYWVYFGTDETALPQTAGTFISQTQYQPTLTESGTYYLRLQAQDQTGNVDPQVFAPFIYKFDNTPPDNPPLISATPSGFTSNNNFTFEWPNASDAHSGIDVYCYRTGATTGAFSQEICTKDLHIDNISAAYLQGTNVFYVRTRDVAGNYATYSAQVSFYYSTAPPQPVQNLRAIPPVSAQNLFAFTWDLPPLFSGDASRLTYCFSINELPSSLNTTCTTDKYIPAFKAATQQGTNILYMVAKDEANNVNWNSYAAANFIANTVSPGIPLNLSITDSSDRASDRWSLTATWTKPTFEGNGIDHYIVERSDNNHTYEAIGTVSNAAFVDMTVVPEKVYYYRVRAADNIGNTGGASGIVSQKALGRFIEPPDIVSQPTAKSGFDQADITWVTSRPATSFVYYGTKPNDLQQSKGTLDASTEHRVTITGLSASSVYYFKVQSFDQDRSYGLEDTYSQIYTFRTAETARIHGVSASDITLSTALINWQTSVPTKAKIEYGLTTDYGFYQEDETVVAVNHFLKLSNLQSGTTYHYRIAATTDFGSVIYSDDYVLTTIPLPRVSNIRFQPIQNAATIAVAVTWTTNVPTDSSVTYSTQGLTKEVATTDLKTNHRLELYDLAGSADYLIAVKGRDAFGNIARADNQRWTSQVDTRAPRISDVSVDVSSMGAWGNAKAQVVISWNTDEPASSQVEYRGLLQDKATVTILDPEPKTNHVVVISNLELSQVYRLKPISRDISGNTTRGQEITSVTPDSQNSLLDIIIKALQSITGQQ